MGTWGGGVFQGDSALDHLEALCEPMLDRIEKTLGSTARMRKDLEKETLLCDIDLLTAISEHVSKNNRGVFRLGWVYPVVLPEPKEIEGWKAQYLEIWEANVDEYGPTPGYKRTRRKVIVEVFDRFAALARKQKKCYQNVEKRIVLPGKPAGKLLDE
jgi:hypothetical protein